MEFFTYNNDMDVAGQWSWILLLKEFPCLSGNIACHWHACDRTDCRFLRLYQLFSLLIYHKYPIFVSFFFFCNFTIAIIFCSTFMKKKKRNIFPVTLSVLFIMSWICIVCHWWIYAKIRHLQITWSLQYLHLIPTPLKLPIPWQHCLCMHTPLLKE